MEEHMGRTDEIGDALIVVRLAELNRLYALEPEVERLLKFTATCTCGTPGLDYEGPQADCAVHGAVRAYNETQAQMAAIRTLITENYGADYDDEDVPAAVERLMRHLGEHEANVLRLRQSKNVALEKAQAAIERVKGIHHRSMFPATSGEDRGKHYCPACTYTDDGWTAYAVWPCATAAAITSLDGEVMSVPPGPTATPPAP